MYDTVSCGYDYRDRLDGITSRTSATQGNHTYAFDAFQRMQSLTTAAGTTSYLYTSDNLRAKKAGPLGTFDYIYAGGVLLAETGNGTTSIATEYLWFQGMPIGLIRGGQRYAIENDHLETSARLP